MAQEQTYFTLPLTPIALEDVLKTLREAGNLIDDNALTGNDDDPSDQPSVLDHAQHLDAAEMRSNLPDGINPDDLLSKPRETLDVDGPEYLHAWLNGLEFPEAFETKPLKSSKPASKAATSPPAKIAKRRAAEKDRRSPKKVDFMRYQYERDFAEAKKAVAGQGEEEMEVIDFASLGIDMEAE